MTGSEIVITFNDNGVEYRESLSDIIPEWDDLESDVTTILDASLDKYYAYYDDISEINSATAITAAVPPIVLKIGKDILLGIAKNEVEKFLEGNPNSTIQNVIDYVIDSIFGGNNAEVKKDKNLFNALKLDDGVIGGWLRAALEEIINSEFGDLVSDGVAGI
jgi:hypothetical protein